MYITSVRLFTTHLKFTKQIFEIILSEYNQLDFMVEILETADYILVIELIN